MTLARQAAAGPRLLSIGREGGDTLIQGETNTLPQRRSPAVLTRKAESNFSSE